MASAIGTCNVKCETYSNSIIPRIYDHLVKGTLGDCILSVEGKFVRAHKLILSISSEYFENIFNVSLVDKPVVVIHGIKFMDLCFILDFAYLGQAQVPQDHLDDFLRAGEFLQIRGIKEGRIRYFESHVQTTMQATTGSRSFDSTISSTQETSAGPSAKRPRDDEDITIQEASEIMKMLLETNGDPDQSLQVKTSQTSQQYVQARITPAPRKPAMSSAIPVKAAAVKPKFLCRFCGRGLVTQGRIKRHETECTENPNKAVATCDICKAEMKPSSLNQHKTTKHRQGKGRAPSIQPDNSIAAIQALPIIGGSPSTQLNDIGTTSQSPEQKEAAASADTLNVKEEIIEDDKGQEPTNL